MRGEQEENEVIAMNTEDKCTIREHFDENPRAKLLLSQDWSSPPLTRNSGHPVFVGLRTPGLGEADRPDVGVGGEVQGGGRL